MIVSNSTYNYKIFLIFDTSNCLGGTEAQSSEKQRFCAFSESHFLYLKQLNRD